MLQNLIYEVLTKFTFLTIIAENIRLIRQNTSSAQTCHTNNTGGFMSEGWGTYPGGGEEAAGGWVGG
jgi:hypothetical protein